MKHLLIVIIGCLSVCVNGIGQTTTPADTVLAEEYYQKGEALTNALKDFETALDYYEKAAAIFLKYEKWERYVDCLNGISFTYYRLNQKFKSYQVATRAIELVKIWLGENSRQECSANQLIGDYYYALGDNKRALQFYEASLIIFNSLNEQEVRSRRSILNRIGSANAWLGRYSIAEKQLKEVAYLVEEEFGRSHHYLGYVFNTLGGIKLSMYLYDSAICYFEKSLEIMSKHYGNNEKELTGVLNNISLAYLYNGDYEMAKLFNNKAISCVETYQSDYWTSAPLLYNNLGVVYREEGNEEMMIWCYRKSLYLHQKSFGRSRLMDKALTYENLCFYFKDKMEYDSAVYFADQSLAIRRGISNNYLITKSYDALGVLYSEMGDYDRAEEFFFKSLGLYQRMSGDFYNKVAYTWSFLGDMYYRQEKYLKAVESYHRSLCLYSNTIFDTLSYSNTPTSIDVGGAPNYLYNYSRKALSMSRLYSVSGDLRNLLFSYQTYQQCDTVVENIRTVHLKYEDKVRLNNEARKTYEGAISVSLQLYQLTKEISYLHSAFYFSERSKAAALSHGLSDLKARSLSGVPQELLSLESRLKSDMAVYQQQAQDEKSKLDESDSASVAYFQDRLFYATRLYDSLIRVLEKNYPHYYALKYSTNTVSLIDLEAKLDKNTALIEYFVGDSTTYVFYATRGQSGYVELPNTKTLHDDVVALRANLNPQQVYDNPSGSYDAFVKASARVYDEYVKHVIQKLPASVTNLIIIPDGSLGYIPFEVLLTARPVSGDYASLPYLMKRYRVSYGYSASLLEEYESVHKKNSKVNYLAFAPRYASEETDSTRLLRLGRYRSQVTPLHWNTAEAIRIGRYLPGKSLVDDEAKESVFKEEVNKYSILHLAMHALVDDQRPMNSKFVFSAASDSTEDGFLTANELYAMDLSAELVVLSACETGYGKLEKGEGIMSLARAFSYAGCPSVVMSHWVVDDEATAQLMEYFYKHLSSGLSKDEALQQARVDYLAHADVVKQHPAFWAGFVVLGDTRAITERSSGWVYVMIGGIVLIAVGFYLSKKLRRRT